MVYCPVNHSTVRFKYHVIWIFTDGLLSSKPLYSKIPNWFSMMFLFISADPPVVSVPVEKNVPESTRLSVTCSVDANPYPYQITWEKVGTLLHFSAMCA